MVPHMDVTPKLGQCRSQYPTCPQCRVPSKVTEIKTVRPISAFISTVNIKLANYSTYFSHQIRRNYRGRKMTRNRPLYDASISLRLSVTWTAIPEVWCRALHFKSLERILISYIDIFTGSWFMNSLSNFAKYKLSLGVKR